MSSFNPLTAVFLGDFLRIVGVLPAKLRARLGLVFVGMLVLAVLEVLGILSLTMLGLSIVAPERLSQYPTVAFLIGLSPDVQAYTADPRNLALVVALGVVLIIGIKNLLAAIVGYQTARFGEKLSIHAGERIFFNYLHSTYLQHMAGTGMKMFHALTRRDRLGTMCVQLLGFYCYVLITVALILTLVNATPLTLMITLSAVALITWFLYRGMKRSVDRAGRIAGESAACESVATLNAMHGIREVLIYRQQQVFHRAYADGCKAGSTSKAFLAVAPPIPTWILEIVGFSVIPVTLWIMVRYHDSSMADMTETLSLIMLASWRILPILNRSLGCLVTARGLRHAAMECLEHVEYALAHPPTPAPEPTPGFAIRDAVRLEQVSFRYPGATTDALHGIDLVVPKGHQVGIVGASGSGKSTIAAVLSGLVPPTSGRLTVDGKALDEADLAAFTQRVGYVPQSPYIMTGTLAENVAFSQWGRPIDEARVRQACRMAALDLVETHPSGIAIPIGERGTGISGGQAQRVCIARVLYADPEILILDEATSALDQGTEVAIVETVCRLRGRITSVIIAHRLTTVRHCDHIVWLDHGRVVEQGPPEVILPRYERSLADSGEKG